MQTHVKVLGVLYLAVGGCMLIGALFLAMTMGGVAGIVGASADPEDAAIAVPILGIAGTALAGFFGIFSLPSLITGYGLLNFKPWARIVGIVLSAISLIMIPFGTIVGAYGLWVLLSKETERLFSSAPLTSSTPVS
ncbi:MAG TPA: hypothetical protein VK527_03660 [Candidatus Limnocylindrales bacterium]|nr:hypothetical protein [Candidatus Limnocylindrales bacterium]